MLEIGSLIDGKYKILNKIGQGGMSVVYLAMNEKANKQWAIKEVRKDGIKDFEVVKQGLAVETDMLKRLSHPSLPSIIDVIEDENTLLIVMDYIEGNPLSTSLKEYGAQRQEDVIGWAIQLCDVLGYLHTREPAIIYRDMKPSNVMLKHNGTVTLIDFGTAREFKERNLADTTCLGTVGYAAPEQFGGQGQTDPRTDIYCLGATLYHLITGCNPCEPPYEMLPIRQINSDLSSGIEKIILKCTQRNPEDRYQSCTELMYALEHYEEMDDAYRKIQTKKVKIFAGVCGLSLLMLGSGITTKVLASRMVKDTYADKMEEAKLTYSNESKLAAYEAAIEIDPANPEAYLGLVDAYKEDATYTTSEEEVIISHIKNNKNLILQRDELGYANLCFEMGRMYWYYYTPEVTGQQHNGESDANRVRRMKAAVSWFTDAINLGGENFANKNMARIYSEIGLFYRDIDMNVTEASDRGMYEAYFNTLTELVEIIQQSEESEIIQLEVYQLSVYSINKYKNYFKSDGIEQEKLCELVQLITQGINGVQTTTEKTTSMKETTVQGLDGMLEEIQVMYLY